MTKVKWIAMMAAVMALGMIGCDDDDDDDADNTTPPPAAGSYAGTWTGTVCGRGLTMVVNQNGTSLSGSYTFTNPTFSGTFSGTVTSPNPPATARLDCAGHNWWFDLTFGSFNQMSGGFYKQEEGGLVCSVSATK